MVEIRRHLATTQRRHRKFKRSTRVCPPHVTLHLYKSDLNQRPTPRTVLLCFARRKPRASRPDFNTTHYQGRLPLLVIVLCLFHRRSPRRSIARPAVPFRLFRLLAPAAFRSHTVDFGGCGCRSVAAVILPSLGLVPKGSDRAVAAEKLGTTAPVWRQGNGRCDNRRLPACGCVWKGGALRTRTTRWLGHVACWWPPELSAKVTARCWTGASGSRVACENGTEHVLGGRLGIVHRFRWRYFTLEPLEGKQRPPRRNDNSFR